MDIGNGCRDVEQSRHIVDPSKQKCVDVKVARRRVLVKIGNGEETGRAHVGGPYLVCALLPRRKSSAVIV
jgi:hypothetical protein